MRILFIGIVIFPVLAMGHPVIYKDGWVYWGSFAPNMNTQRVSYTFHPKASIETNSSWYLNNNDYRDYTLGVNYLVKRWLNQDSQGNLYAAYHAGYFNDSSADGEVHHTMLMGDWESRSIYTAGSAMAFFYDGEQRYKYSGRIGFAPYVAGMNTLQNWLILKVDYFKQQNRNVTITPMMRFFYRNALWEMGSNTKGDYFLTLMVHY
jgi:hypothetical protein